MKSGFEVDPLAIRLPGRPPAVAERNDESALAWRREMERAQMEAWLSHATPGLPGAAQPVPVLRDTAAIGKSVGYAPDAKALATLESAGPHPATLRAAVTLPLGAHPVTESARWVAIDRPDTGPGAKPLEGLHLQRASQIEWAATMAEPLHGGPGSVRVRETVPNLLAPGGQLPVAPVHERTAQLVSLLQGVGTVVEAAAAGQRGAADTAIQAPAPATPEVSGTQVMSPSARSPSLTTFIDGPPDTSATMQPAPGAVDLPAAMATLNGASARSAAQVRVADHIGAEGPGRTPCLASGGGAAPREPIRLHADWSAEGLHLWLGMDASQLASLQSITAQLQRWLSTQGLKLLSMSCNGRVVVEQTDRQMNSDALDAEIERADVHAVPVQTTPTLKESP